MNYHVQIIDCWLGHLCMRKCLTQKMMKQIHVILKKKSVSMVVTIETFVSDMVAIETNVSGDIHHGDILIINRSEALIINIYLLKL